jgi:hypothetical protein
MPELVTRVRHEDQVHMLQEWVRQNVRLLVVPDLAHHEHTACRWRNINLGRIGGQHGVVDDHVRCHGMHDLGPLAHAVRASFDDRAEFGLAQRFGRVVSRVEHDLRSRLLAADGAGKVQPTHEMPKSPAIA